MLGNPLSTLQTPDVNLAAALWTLGARFILDADGSLLVRLSKDAAGTKTRRPFFTFQDDQKVAHPYPSPGPVDVAKLWARYESDDWQAKHWLDPLCYLRRAFDAYASLVNAIPRAAKRYPENHAQLLQTRNTKMAATFCAFGASFPVVVRPDGQPWADFVFAQEKLRAGYPTERNLATTTDIAALYAHPGYYKQHPNSPLAHCKFGLENRERLMDAAAKKLPFCAVNVGGRQWLVKPRQTEDGKLIVKLPNL